MKQPEQLGSYVILEPLPLENKTETGIILLKPQSDDRIGKVISAPIDSQLSPGDKVLFAGRAATCINDKCTQVSISEDNIYCILEKNPLTVNLGVV